jgi:uncharacterized protein YegL
MNTLVLRQQDLLENPTNRVAVALCLDVSDSMSGDPIKELNQGVRQFFEAIRADPIAQASAEVAIVAFADRTAVCLDFQGVDRVGIPPELQTRTELGFQTNLGAGVNLALDILDVRKQDYKAAGVDYFQPFLVLMTDGQPTTQEHVSAAERVRALEAKRSLVVMPIGIGGAADMNVLGMFSGKKRPLRLQGLAFGAFFEWLSSSIKRVSESRPGEPIELDIQAMASWAHL